jgi:hypothetical protein
MGHLDEADRHFAACEQFCARIGLPTWLARTRAEWADLLRNRSAAGDAERARELATQALSTAEDLGMAGVADQAGAVLA